MIADLESNPPNRPAIAPKSPQRRFTEQDVHFIAAKVARGITETGAVLMLGRMPRSWFAWKNRAKRGEKFAELLTHLKETYIERNLNEIGKAATGSDGIRHDWRAADRLNAIMAPERFSQQQAQVSVNSSVTIQLGGSDAVRQLVAQAAAEAMRQVSAPAEVERKTLPEVGTTDKAIDV